MEQTHGRPTLGEVFCPPTHALNQGNDYLSRVGLVILIRGSPSPGMPRLLAQTLAIVHGGQREDYDVAEATIAPYLITCRSTQLRDAVVQRGVYTNPHAQVQFAVHEWRPRFGMGYDPATQQVWVKVVGLPLQAWTTPEITTFLQKFGHPLRIMPFGRQAGHYKDITALVAVKDPNRIPLAYTYREGDYATQVDVYILSWRLWKDSPFPPPRDFDSGQNRYVQPQRHGNTPNLELNSFSSSSSNGAPSEPTIDLSAWSPRSRQITTHSTENEPNRVLQLDEEEDDRGVKTPRSVLPLLFTISDKLASHEPHRTQVAADPNLPHDSARLSMLRLLCSCLAPAHSPIDINLFCSLCTVDWNGAPLGEARGKERYSYTIFVQGRYRREMCAETLINALTPNLVVEKDLDSTSAVQVGGLLKPADSIQEVNNISPCFTSPTQAKNFYSPCPARLRSPYFPSLIPAHAKSFGSTSSPDGPPLIQPRFLEMQESTLLSIPEGPNQITQLALEAHGIGTEDLSATALTAQEDTTLRQAFSLPNKSQKGKYKKIPVRRSQRLQAREQASQTASVSSGRNKQHHSKINFTPDTQMTPLDTSQTLQILQATGLLVNTQIETLIEEAVQRDREFEAIDQPAPQTPLHDHIPPLTVPGTDLLL